MVQVLGAPPILVTLEVAGLRVGTRFVLSEGVSEDRLEPLLHAPFWWKVPGRSALGLLNLLGC